MAGWTTVTEPATAADPSTRWSLHVLAEHVLGAGLYAATGRIGLRVVPGGFGTPPWADAALGGSFSVRHGELVVTRADGGTRQAPVTTVADAAAFFGVEPGMPSHVYPPTTRFDRHDLLPIDTDTAEELAAWFELGDAALARFAAAHADESPTDATLWPEHFDLARTMDEVNYGASPGDAGHGEPYLYVGPWTTRDGAFWNEPFGASRPAATVHAIDDAVAFFEQGRAETLARP
jgi:hypothetical protein